MVAVIVGFDCVSGRACACVCVCVCAFAYHVCVVFVSSRKIALEERLFSPAKLYAKTSKNKNKSATFLSRKVVLSLPEEDLKLMLTEEC